MTKSTLAQQGFMPGTSQRARSARTLALQMAMEEERQREVGARIKELRGPRPQPLVADAVHVTLRAYQAWEAGGGIAWENLQALAKFFEVSENYLLYGAEVPRGPETQLDRIEIKLDEVLSRLPATDLAADLEQELDAALAQDAAPSQDSAPSVRTPGRRGKAR